MTKQDTSIIEGLEWRYATKKFDPSRSVDADKIEILKKAIQLTPTSYGLQLYKTLIVTNDELKAKLLPASWGQSQVTDCSHLFVFASRTNIKKQDIEDFMRLTGDVRDINYEENLTGYTDFIFNKLSERSEEELRIWTAKQTYIALGTLMAACGELRIDNCPMEGFEADQYDEILGLKDENYHTAVICAVGYRSEDDQNQHATKVRRPMGTLIEHRD